MLLSAGGPLGLSCLTIREAWLWVYEWPEDKHALVAALGGGRDTSQDGDLMPTVSQGAEKRRRGAEGWGGIRIYFKFSFLIPCTLLPSYIHINTVNSNDPK